MELSSCLVCIETKTVTFAGQVLIFNDGYLAQHNMRGKTQRGDNILVEKEKYAGIAKGGKNPPKNILNIISLTGGRS